MHQVLTHPWDLSEGEALELQRSLATQVERVDRLGIVTAVAGVDVAYHKDKDLLVAGVVLLDAEQLTVIEQVTAQDVPRFPYVPGLFSFRELPAIALALKQLRETPHLIICDGQGIAHPRRFGLACHLGLLFDVPTIGCAKSLLVGEHTTVGSARGDEASIVDANEVIGSALRTQDATNPVYVSTGHRVSLATALRWVLKLSPHYRLPETTRLADQLVKRVLSSHGPG